MARTGSVPVSLSEPTTEMVTVDYASADGTASHEAGDYTPVSGTLTFSPGQTAKTIAVEASDDAADEGDKTFTISLSNASNGTISPSSGVGTVTIQQITNAARNAVPGVTIIPGGDDFVYDTMPIVTKRSDGSWEGHNLRAAIADGLATVSGGTGSSPTVTGVTNATKTDMTRSFDQMADYPNLRHGSVVVAWFGDSVDVGACTIRPLTTYKNGSVKMWDPTYNGGLGDWKDWKWQVSGIDHTSSDAAEPAKDGTGSFIYGGTPSDSGVIRTIQDLKARGKRVTFYPFIMMTSSGLPWRGRITLGSPSDDLTATATSDVATFMGNAQPAHFSRNTYWQTVYYSGPSEWSFRRMILHYANLCVLAGGVDLFLIGSEMRGLESIRGPGWTPAGVPDGAGHVTWDYPFVAALKTLAADVRAIFDAAGFTKDTVNKKNLIAYAADWSTFCGVKHNRTSGPGASEEGIWPHLDQLFADANIDLVCFDNYAPVADWPTGTTAATNKDIANWSGTPPTTWPPTDPNTVGLGLSGTPGFTLEYIQSQIEGGQNYHWIYYNSENGTLPSGETGYNDPNNSTGLISRPQGDRLSQTRVRLYEGQELLASKRIRWWWNNPHKPVYDNGTGTGWMPRGTATTQWVPQSKSIVYTEYGCSSTMFGCNQPNVFFDPKSSESYIPWWGTVVYNSGGSPTWKPTYSVEAMSLYIQAHASYWDLNNEISSEGVKLRDTDFDALWTWDARPYPHFPDLEDVWGDFGNWVFGHWINGKL